MNAIHNKRLNALPEPVDPKRMYGLSPTCESLAQDTFNHNQCQDNEREDENIGRTGLFIIFPKRVTLDTTVAQTSSDGVFLSTAIRSI